MDIQEKGRQEEEASDEQVNPNLVITITMKKMESQTGSGAGGSALGQVNVNQALSGDKNNNEGSVKSVVKKESAAKEFCKNLFNKSISMGDRNNNSSQPTPAVINQYTKVTVEALLSHQNQQMMSQLAQHVNGITLSQNGETKRWVDWFPSTILITVHYSTWRHVHNSPVLRHVISTNEKFRELSQTFVNNFFSPSNFLSLPIHLLEPTKYLFRGKTYVTRQIIVSASNEIQSLIILCFIDEAERRIRVKNSFPDHFNGKRIFLYQTQ